jgi:Co/Zn/Cd efflux system component/copper chaperone CopZ
MTTTRLHVPRMDCAAEEQLVRMRLASLAGVRAVEVDLDDRTVWIEHDGDGGDVVSAVVELGLGSVSTVEAPAPRLDGRAAGRTRAERRALGVALAINAVFFVVELTAGLLAGSLGLVADSLDMLADASVYALSLLAVGRVVAQQKRLAVLSGYLQMTLAVLGLVEVVRRAVAGEVLPDVATMVVVAAAALVANVVTLLVLRRARGEAAHLQAAWIFTSNDVKVNALVIVAALLVSATGSGAPDLVAGAVIFVIVANGARRIIRLGRSA